ncbi:cytochrome P450 [Roseateles sp. BYS96W]|uniref:Cytochrome P450 n=1 Tax=Pelomonas nitida TaxID=3299027 RepID=A0ABW7G9B7_9BURK
MEGETLSPQEVHDQCMVSFQAGHETSATALLWWSWLLAAHPAIQARVRDEVDAVLAGRVPTADDAGALPLLSATLKEAMRLQRFELRPVSTEAPKPRLAVTLRPEGGLTLRLAARS